MKIYIQNFNIDILPDIMKQLAANYTHTESYTIIYSECGIYRIDDDTTIKRMVCLDKDIQILKNYYNELTLIADPSYYTTEIVNNIQPQHISTSVKRCFFEINEKSKIQMVIEGEETKNVNVNSLINPYDIYFEVPNNIDINDALVKKEIIVFLSLLN
jgi:hypothetical protein